MCPTEMKILFEPGANFVTRVSMLFAVANLSIACASEITFISCKWPVKDGYVPMTYKIGENVFARWSEGSGWEGNECISHPTVTCHLDETEFKMKNDLLNSNGQIIWSERVTINRRTGEYIGSYRKQSGDSDVHRMQCEKTEEPSLKPRKF